MTHIVVFGGVGQVGLAIRDVMAEFPSCRITSLTRVEADITSGDSVLRAVKKYKPDCVINAAGWTAVDAAETDPDGAFAVNETGPRHIAAACAAVDIPMIHMSTDYVFDGEKRTPYTETDIPNPLSVYGASKLAGDRAIMATWNRHVIIRSGWIFSRAGKSFLSKIMTLCQTRPDLGIVADQTGCPTPAHDLARVLLTVAQHSVQRDFTDWGMYNMCGAPIATWHDMAVHIAAILREYGERNIAAIRPIQTHEYPLPAKRPAYSALDCGKIKAVFGIAQPDWRTAIRDYCVT